MKICHITNVHGAFDGRIFYKMAVSGVEYGHQVTLIAPHDKSEIRDGITILPVKKQASRIKRMLSTYKILQLAIEVDADIYHFHDVELIPVMLKLKKKTAKGVIYDIHEYNKEAILNKGWIPKPLRKLFSFLTWKMELMACKTFDGTISATKELAEVFEPYSKKNEFIWNFDFKKGINLSYKPFMKDIDIIHVGILSKERMGFLLSIARELNHMGFYYHWCFIGVKKERYEGLLKQLDEKSLAHLTFIDKIPFVEVEQFYQRSKIGINYHKLNGQLKVAMPLKIFEYMSQGLTVITSDLPPIHRFLENKVNGIIVEKNTVEEFCEALITTMEENNFLKTSIVNKLKILNQYNWESEAIKLMKIYEEVYEDVKTNLVMKRF